MKQYGFVTFRPHPNDHDLINEFKTLISPILNKCDHYLVGHESANTPQAHLHIILSYENKDSDRSKVIQKFTNKTLKQFYQKIKNEKRFTIIDSKFNDKGLNIKSIPKTEEDYISTLGYCAKEHILSSKGYSLDFVNTAVDFYYKSTRLKLSKKLLNPWRVLNTRTAHAYITDFCDKNNIQINDDIEPFVLQKLMAQQGISCVELSNQRYELIINDLINYHNHNNKTNYDPYPNSCHPFASGHLTNCDCHDCKQLENM